MAALCVSASPTLENDYSYGDTAQNSTVKTHNYSDNIADEEFGPQYHRARQHDDQTPQNDRGKNNCDSHARNNPAGICAE